MIVYQAMIVYIRNMFESPSEETTRELTTRELAETLRPEWHNLMLEAKEVNPSPDARRV
jgi:hypothetical protein